MTNNGELKVWDLQEEIEKAFKAGFECAMENTEVDDDGQIWNVSGFSIDKAVIDYVNGNK